MKIQSSKPVYFVFLVVVWCSMLIDNGLLVYGASERNVERSQSFKRGKVNSTNSANTNPSLHPKNKPMDFFKGNGSLESSDQIGLGTVRNIAQTGPNSLSPHLALNVSIIDERNPNSFFIKDLIDDFHYEIANHTTFHHFQKMKALSAYFVRKDTSRNLTIKISRAQKTQAINPFLAFQNFTKFPNQTFLESFLGSSFPIKLMNGSILQDELVPLAWLDELYPPWDNLTKEEQEAFLNLTLGSPLKYGSKGTYGLGAYYSTLLFVGIPGNVLTCLIILTNSYMRTAPNFFLFNIALADFVTLITGR